MNRNSILLSGMLLLIFAMLIVPESHSQKPPNILIILTDDHGWADLGENGVNGDVNTPNVDQLARDGVRFTRGYVTAPQCTPSRAGVITGIYQPRLGVEHNGDLLPLEAKTLAEHLKAAGYISGISGKWHLDIESNKEGSGPRMIARPEYLPHCQGFDEYFTGVMQDYIASHALDGSPYADAPKKVHEKGCRVVIQTEAALSFLKRRAENPAQPWFLFVSYMAPHTPLEAAEPWFSQTPEHLSLIRRKGLSLIGAIDDGVGRIREQLRTMGQEENTLVFYLGDNGAPLPPSDPEARNPWDGSINLPMLGQKGMLAEGGIRVPFVAAWPGRIPENQVFDKPVISLDMTATAIAASGLSVQKELDGVDLLPFLTGKRKGLPHKTLYWRWLDQAAIQEFPYKLIIRGGKEPLLFDITTPEGELHKNNLAAVEQGIAFHLQKKLEKWMDGLQPPGPPESIAPHREEYYVKHGIISSE